MSAPEAVRISLTSDEVELVIRALTMTRPTTTPAGTVQLLTFVLQLGTGNVIISVAPATEA